MSCVRKYVFNCQDISDFVYRAWEYQCACSIGARRSRRITNWRIWRRKEDLYIRSAGHSRNWRDKLAGDWVIISIQSYLICCVLVYDIWCGNECGCDVLSYWKLHEDGKESDKFNKYVCSFCYWCSYHIVWM